MSTPDISNLTPEQIQSIMAENEKLKAAAAKRSTLTLKVSEKKALSLYGTSRFPITLYKAQWEKVLNHANEIRAFIAAHPELATKD